MLRNLILVVLAAPFFFSDCQEIDDWTRYVVGFENDLVVHAPIKTMDATPEEDTTNVITSPLFTPDFTKKLEERGDERKQVEKVRMSEFNFSFAASDSNMTLDFLKKIHFFMDSPGSESLKIGQASEVKAGSRNINVGILFPWEQEMLPYIENGYQIRIEFEAKDQIPEDLTFRCASVFQVDTKKFGI